MEGHHINNHGLIACCVNSRAGNGKAVKLAGRVSDILKEKAIAHQVLMEPWPDQLDGFSEAWIFGGDGTVNYFVNQYPEIDIPLAVFAGGTGNDFAWKLSGEVQLTQHVESVLTVQPRRIDAIRCNERLALNGIGLGFDGEVLKFIDSIRFIGGHLGYQIAVLFKIFTFREIEFTVYCDGIRTDDKFLLLMICNSSRMGGGFMVAPMAEISDGWLDLIMVKPMGVMQRLFNLPKLEKGLHINTEYTTTKKIRGITITPSIRCPIQIDGELFYYDQLDIEILPKKFRFKY
ncbi:MAG TPA: diacylglycerol kinase family protein [Saprospiraceae bacterium]|nr:diacylglycerol kinase family protein [Saprospiraceae bacterium]